MIQYFIGRAYGRRGLRWSTKRLNSLQCPDKVKILLFCPPFAEMSHLFKMPFVCDPKTFNNKGDVLVASKPVLLPLYKK